MADRTAGFWTIAEGRRLTYKFEPQHATLKPPAGYVRLRLAAAGINRADILQIHGHYRPPVDQSPIPGLEASGVVEAVGQGVTSPQVGDHVTALCNGGAFASHVLVPAAQVWVVGAALPLTKAAAIPESLVTAYQNLMLSAQPLRANEWVLIHNAGGGLGLTAIRLAKHLGARVLATARRSEQQAVCLQAGAEAVWDHSRDDWPTSVMQHTKNYGIDAILDPAPIPHTNGNLQVLAMNGRWHVIGLLHGRDLMLDGRVLMQKNITMTSRTLRDQPHERKAMMMQDIWQQLKAPLLDGTFTPHIGHILPMSQLPQAIELMDQQQHTGKVVVVRE